MTTKSPQLIALHFNDCITNQDLDGLSRLMTDDHVFIDREGVVHQPKSVMVEGWREFFKAFPKYKNTFTHIEVKENLVVMLGYAYWSEEQPHDAAIWTARVAEGRVREWRVYYDTPENRYRLQVRPANALSAR